MNIIIDENGVADVYDETSSRTRDLYIGFF